ncbi:hypothetical protein [Mycobacterium paraterrae]|uniref:Uncharacterized protein n=1 Tax=Mycobacterium paraterrae TaxID=577492 RepID=A0ABY3VR64_9MYCO|nr:hypothetical protein [Mycobacterium paraterrae]UMB70611.1 hypothetical protein MKK62_04660 [Mycobacterium paraterrae]
MPFLPAICVGDGLAVTLEVGEATADDIIADDVEVAAELDEELLELFDW